MSIAAQTKDYIDDDDDYNITISSILTRDPHREIVKWNDLNVCVLTWAT